MSFKSRQHIDKFKELEESGKIAKGTTEKRLAETKDPHKLPERKSPVRSIEHIKVIARRKAKR